MTFRAGQKVVCVADRRDGGFGDEIYPTKGMVYTIRSFAPIYDGSRPRVWLCEITNAPRPYYEGWHEKGFGVERFRPIVERKTDISAFHEILRKASRKDRVRA